MKARRGELPTNSSAMNTSRSELSVSSKSSNKSSTIAKVASLASFTHRSQASSHLLSGLAKIFRMKDLSRIDESAELSRISDDIADELDEAPAYSPDNADVHMEEAVEPPNESNEAIDNTEINVDESLDSLSERNRVNVRAAAERSADIAESSRNNQPQNETSYDSRNSETKAPLPPVHTTFSPKLVAEREQSKTKDLAKVAALLNRERHRNKALKELTEGSVALEDERKLLQKSLSEITK